MKYFEKIDRQFMELVNRFDKAVSTFHAFRSLWAALAANREQCGLTRESLETHQCRQLIEILSTAELMRDHLGIKWCTVLSGVNAQTVTTMGANVSGVMVLGRFCHGK